MYDFFFEFLGIKQPGWPVAITRVSMRRDRGKQYQWENGWRSCRPRVICQDLANCCYGAIDFYGKEVNKDETNTIVSIIQVQVSSSP